MLYIYFMIIKLRGGKRFSTTFSLHHYARIFRKAKDIMSCSLCNCSERTSAPVTSTTTPSGKSGKKINTDSAHCGQTYIRFALLRNAPCPHFAQNNLPHP